MYNSSFTQKKLVSMILVDILFLVLTESTCAGGGEVEGRDIDLSGDNM